MRFSTIALVATLAAGLAIAALFVLQPGLDLAAAGLFYQPGQGFIGDGTLGRWGRRVGYVVPFLVLFAFVGAFAAARLGRPLPGFRPSGRAVAFLVATMALGPGLVVNLGLKDHSGRPRPVQVEQFGGARRFQPFWSLAGECRRNCSFVSGEASTGYWLAAPASLAPPPWRGPAIAAALVFGTAVGALRMAFGGHFLSDVLFAGVVTLLVILLARRLTFRGGED